MNKSLSNSLTLLFAVIGCLVSLLLTFGEHVTSSATGCFQNGEGCASTTGSAYGHLGPVPTAVFGILMYVAFIALCLARGKRLRLMRDREAARAAAYASSASSEFENTGLGDDARQAVHSPDIAGTTGGALSGGVSTRTLDAATWGLALLGFGISVWLQYVAIYQLHSFCKYCFASATLVTLIFALASRDFLLDGRELNGEQKMIGGVLALIVVLGSFMVIPDILILVNHPHIATAQPVPDARGPLTDSLLHFKGDANAKYTLIEFADYQCGHCAAAAKEMDKLLKSHQKDIRFVFRNNPLSVHKWAREAAAAAEAAGEQNKFWEMHDLLFKHQLDMEGGLFNNAEFENYARELRLNVAKFNKDRMSDAIETRINRDLAAGMAGRVESTPTFFFVAPNHVTSLPGTIELQKLLDKPSSKEWE